MVYNHVMKIALPPPIVQLQNLLLPHPMFLVGGFVRDSVMGKISTDYDVCSALAPSQLIMLLGSNAKTKLVSAKLGTLNIMLGGAVIEHTTFRSELYLPQGKHTPIDCAFVSSVEQDAERRDFTINAIYANAQTGELTDLFGGVADLKRKLVRSVQAPSKTILDDPLRILRMARFAACFGFAIDKATTLGASSNAYRLKAITKTRIWDEVSKTLHYGVAATQRFFGILQEVGALEVVFGRGDVPSFAGVFEGDAIAHFVWHLAQGLGKQQGNVPSSLWEALPQKQIKQVVLSLENYHTNQDAFLLFEQAYPHAEQAIRLIGYQNKSRAAELTKQLEQAKSNNLWTGQNSLAINGNDIAAHFPCLERQNYATILRACKRSVFAQTVPNTKAALLQEIKKYG